jgi:hypothetical protein
VGTVSTDDVPRISAAAASAVAAVDTAMARLVALVSNSTVSKN